VDPADGSAHAQASGDLPQGADHAGRVPVAKALRHGMGGEGADASAGDAGCGAGGDGAGLDGGAAGAVRAEHVRFPLGADVRWIGGPGR
jgi:hypothetical protein